MIYHLAFDIDGTAAFGFDDEITWEKLIEKEPWVYFFKERGLVLEALTPHILCPGIIELLKLLLKIENIQISFISAGDNTRNTLFVANFLRLILGPEQFESIKDQIKIISKDVIETDGNKKRLERLDLSPQQLLSTILIDDCAYSSPEDQKNNLLFLPSIQSLSFFRDLFKYHDTLNTEEFYSSHWADFARMNQVFYLTGLLFAAIKKADDCAQELTCALNELQFNSTPWQLKWGKPDIDPPFLHRDTSWQYFADGLKKLQEVNPKLTFFNPLFYFHEQIESSHHRFFVTPHASRAEVSPQSFSPYNNTK